MKTQVTYEPATETAKKIRKALKAAFPQTKFSVTSKTFSGGDSVSVRWTDLPLTEEVQAITSKFQSGHYNGYEDIYESGSYEYEGKLYNGAKYIQCSRNLSDEYKETVNEYLNKHYAVDNMDAWDLNRFFNQAEKKMVEEMNAPVEVAEVVENNENKETKQDTIITCSMNLNNDLNGVELKFSGIPTEAVRNELKSNGFKWSKFNKVWYAKQSTTTIMFAESLVSIYNDIAANPEELEETKAIEVVEAVTTNENTFVGKKVYANFGAMHGGQNGTITNEFNNEIVITWEDGYKEGMFVRDLVYVHENTNMNAVGVYLLPTENKEIDTPEETPALEQIETEYTQDNKIKVSSIKFVWSESNEIEDGQTVSTFEEAESLIKLAAYKAPDNGCYDKTKFLLTWSDGQTYEGRIDIVKSDSFKSAPLKDHVTYFAKSVIEDDGTWHTDEQKEGYRNFLETYSLEDEKEIKSLTKENKQSAKVLDFNSKFKAKQEQKETENMTTHFIDNVLPYMSPEEINELQAAYTSNNENVLNELWKKLMLTTAVRRAKEDILKQN